MRALFAGFCAAVAPRRGLVGVVAFAVLTTSVDGGAFLWPNTAERLEAALKSPDPATRRRAARKLVELPDATARRLTRQALADADVEVRLEAAAAARELRLSGIAGSVVEWLSDRDRRIRLAATQLFELDPDPTSLGSLGRVLGDADAAVRSGAARALGASSPGAVLSLLGHLDDSDAGVRREVVLALARLRDPRAVVPLVSKIQDDRPLVRAAVARALGELGDPRAAGALVLALRDEDEPARIAALGALGRLADPSSVPGIVAVLDTRPSTGVTAAALEALARIGSPQSLNVLVSQLAGSRPEEVSPARSALALVGPKALGALKDCLGARSIERADGCALALGDIGGAEAADAVVTALRRAAVHPVPALAALAALADPSSLPTILEYLSNPDANVRRTAIDALGATLDPTHPDGRAAQPIIVGLERPGLSPSERHALTRLLGRTGSPRAVAVLSPHASGGDDLEQRLSAIEALGTLGPLGQDRVLLDALDDDEPAIRLAAGLALASSGSRTSVTPLMTRLARAAEQDRGAVALALAGPLSRSGDARGVAEFLVRSRGALRDALIEAVARAPNKAGSDPLLNLAHSTPPDRRKLAEALATHPEARKTLLGLLDDTDASVRANAVWSLAEAGDATDLARVIRALADRDVAVAGNAAAALGRLAQRLHADVGKALCQATADRRSYVRANVLAALRVAGKHCSDGVVRRLLHDDRSEVVRARAAALLRDVASADAAGQSGDRAALERCADEDPAGSVATQCVVRPVRLPSGAALLRVYVVPMGEAEPVAEAPFALVRADGLMRLGVTDRRGEVLEALAPNGVVSLAVPAALAR
jgi:HEAT repeat protein